MRHVISGTIAALFLSGVLTTPAHAETSLEQPAGEPADVGITAVPAVSDFVARAAERADSEAADLVAQLLPSQTRDFGLVGVTWTRGFDPAGMTVQVQSRTGGSWSGWQALDVENDEGEGGRDGTEPLWVGSADGVAVRVTSPSGQRPNGLSVATVDPGTIPSDASTATTDNAFFGSTSASSVVQVVDGSPTFTPKPTIISRSAWGARKNTYCDPPRTGNETRGVVVHHTAGTNSYSKSQSASIVRAVQAYHMDGRDWCDIGYNFLIDKYGQTFEGRNGGVDKPVRGAHAGDATVNTYTMGVSMMGTYASAEPTAETKDAMVKLIGWRIGTTFHPATGQYSVGTYSLNRIAGHRNVVSTACPGAAAYGWLSRDGGLRDRVTAYIANYSSAIKTRFEQLTTAVTGPVYVGEYPFSSAGGGRKARLRNLDLYSSPTGTFSVDGYYRQGYTALHAQSGVLGVPTAEKVSTSRSDVSLQRFASGTIYRVSRDGHAAPYSLWGSIEDKYRELGEATGSLGAPVASMARISDGRYRAQFEHGHLTRQANGTVTVIIT